MKQQWIEKGYVDEPVDKTLDLKKEIRRLCEEKDAIVLAHYYTVGDVQDVADFIGDSLALARKAAQTDAKIIFSSLGKVSTIFFALPDVTTTSVSAFTSAVVLT